MDGEWGEGEGVSWGGGEHSANTSPGFRGGGSRQIKQIDVTTFTLHNPLDVGWTQSPTHECYWPNWMVVDKTYGSTRPK